MTAAGILLAMAGVALVYSGVTGNDLRDVIPNVLSGKSAAAGKVRTLRSSPSGEGGGFSGGGGQGGGGSGGGSFSLGVVPPNITRI